MNALVLLLALSAAPPAQASAAPPRDRGAAAVSGDARIRGRVVAADTGAPLRRAQVTLTGEPGVRRQVTTDADGRYELADLPGGRFVVSAAKGGYATLQYGQRRPFEPGRAVTLAAAQLLGDINLALPRGGVIAGRIADRFGDPVVGVEIRVERYRYTAEGRRQLEFSRTGTIATNDLGEFRAFGLMPGEYVVSAAVAGPFRSMPGVLTTYYPGTPNVAEAQGVRVNVGEEAAVQFSVVSGRMARFSGSVVDSTGRPAAGASLMLSTVSGGAASGTGVGSVAPDGSFSFGNVSPGAHFIEVRLQQTRPGGATVFEFANVPISSSGDDVTGLQIATSPGAAVSGRIEWEGNASRTAGSGITPFQIRTSSADGRPAVLGAVTSFDDTVNGMVGKDGTFRIAGMMGRVLLVPVGVPPQWMLKAVMVDDVDVTSAAIDASRFGGETRLRVVLTDKVTEVSGSVANARGEAVTDAVVVVFPEDRVESPLAARSTRAVRPEANGGYKIRALPPGRYVAVALEGLDPGSEWDPVFQATVHDAGRRFTPNEGQQIELKLALLQ